MPISESMNKQIKVKVREFFPYLPHAYLSGKKHVNSQYIILFHKSTHLCTDFNNLIALKLTHLDILEKDMFIELRLCVLPPWTA